jgi:predicted RNA binding protein YcfA (HicA-like mRNA interferase family)
MTQRNKLRRKIRNNPRNVRFNEMKTLLSRFGFELVRTRGSHHFFRFDDGRYVQNITIPAHGTQVKPEYVKQVMDILDRLFPEVGDEMSGETEKDESDDQDA